jgi:hypothetical protein
LRHEVMSADQQHHSQNVNLRGGISSEGKEPHANSVYEKNNIQNMLNNLNQSKKQQLRQQNNKTGPQTPKHPSAWHDTPHFSEGKDPKYQNKGGKIKLDKLKKSDHQ